MKRLSDYTHLYPFPFNRYQIQMTAVVDGVHDMFRTKKDMHFFFLFSKQFLLKPSGKCYLIKMLSVFLKK